MKKQITLAVMVALGLVLSLGLAQAQAKMSLRLQSHMPPQQAERTAGKIVAAVAKASGGEISIKMHPVGTLVPTKHLLEAVGNGTIDMATAPEGYWHKLVPVSIIGQGLPFAFEDCNEATYFMFHKGFLKLLREAYAKHNVYVIPYEPYNTGLMTKKPILKATDLKGLKLRAFGTMQMWLSKMGASTVYIPGGELYTALSTGVVEGAHWGDAYPMYEMKFQEVLKNYMKPEPIIGSWNSLWINLDLWKKLTPKQQALIETAAKGTGFVDVFTDTNTRSKFAIKDMQEKWNVKINQVSQAEIDKMRAKAKEVWKELAASKDPLVHKAFKLLYEFMADLGRPVK